MQKLNIKDRSEYIFENNQNEIGVLTKLLTIHTNSLLR